MVFGATGSPAVNPLMMRNLLSSVGTSGAGGAAGAAGGGPGGIGGLAGGLDLFGAGLGIGQSLSSGIGGFLAAQNAARGAAQRRKIATQTSMRVLERLLGAPRRGTQNVLFGLEDFQVKPGSFESRFLPVGTLLPSVADAPAFTIRNTRTGKVQGRLSGMSQLSKFGFISPEERELSGQELRDLLQGRVGTAATLPGQEHLVLEQVRAGDPELRNAIVGLDPGIFEARQRLMSLMNRGGAIRPQEVAQLEQNAASVLGQQLSQTGQAGSPQELLAALSGLGSAGFASAQPRAQAQAVNEQFRRGLSQQGLQFLQSLFGLSSSVF